MAVSTIRARNGKSSCTGQLHTQQLDPPPSLQRQHGTHLRSVSSSRLAWLDTERITRSVTASMPHASRLRSLAGEHETEQRVRGVRTCMLT